MNRTNFQKKLKETFEVEQLDDEVDLLIYLDFVIFMDRLSKESEKAAIKARQTTIKTAHVDSCVERVLREFRG